jgi:hypothetical protein
MARPTNLNTTTDNTTCGYCLVSLCNGGTLTSSGLCNTTGHIPNLTTNGSNDCWTCATPNTALNPLCPGSDTQTLGTATNIYWTSNTTPISIRKCGDDSYVIKAPGTSNTTTTTTSTTPYRCIAGSNCPTIPVLTEGTVTNLYDYLRLEKDPTSYKMCDSTVRPSNLINDPTGTPTSWTITDPSPFTGNTNIGQCPTTNHTVHVTQANCKYCSVPINSTSMNPDGSCVGGDTVAKIPNHDDFNNVWQCTTTMPTKFECPNGGIFYEGLCGINDCVFTEYEIVPASGNETEADLKCTAESNNCPNIPNLTTSNITNLKSYIKLKVISETDLCN